MSVAIRWGAWSKRGIVEDSADLPYAVDRRELAARLRALLQPTLSSMRLRTVAARLNVTARSLRDSIDGDDPHPSSAVVLAIVQHYGVDPTWLLTGEYDSATHRQALEDPASVVRLLARTTLRLDPLDRFVSTDLVFNDELRHRTNGN